MALKIRNLSLLAVLLTGCSSGPTINIGTKQPLKVDPLKVDLNMRVDVYQHADTSVQKHVTTKPSLATDDVQTRLRNRMGEIQVLKNNRLVGEAHTGLLEVRNQSPGEFGEYVQRTVDAENRDRTAMMQDLAKKKNLPLEDVERQQSELARNKAFNGEWIEVPQTDDTFAWKQKSS